MAISGTIAVTDFGWYTHLRAHPELEEVNFWKPSAHRVFTAPEFSPFFFKLKAPYNAICGFGYYARFASLPDWLAWEAFGVGNGCDSLLELRQRIQSIRERIRFSGPAHADIGCILLVQPTLFAEADWIHQPSDWRARTVSDKQYDLTAGEGARIWAECLARTQASQKSAVTETGVIARPLVPRYGAPALVRPRLGQGTFRIAVTDAYGRACAVTGEHSLPALEAAHIQSFTSAGPHEVRNGLLLRADFHRLFDQGYITVAPDYRIEISPRLKQDYHNGRSYYPFHGEPLRLPSAPELHPDQGFLEWHRQNVYAA
jgi:putative restriction endonuclease